MRKVTATFALVAVLSIATPSFAAPRNGDAPPLTRIVRIIKKVFGIGTTADPMTPVPAPTPGGGN